ncbi:MAG TPA: hypothetical protein DGP25_04190 [Brevundimonas sp.]|nr:hypothetical protein [Brevundimonas sp.]
MDAHVAQIGLRAYRGWTVVRPIAPQKRELAKPFGLVHGCAERARYTEDRPQGLRYPPLRPFETEQSAGDGHARGLAAGFDPTRLDPEVVFVDAADRLEVQSQRRRGWQRERQSGSGV